MYVHLIDGTYELFRHHFGAPSYQNDDGMEVGAVRGVVFSLLGMFRDGATHMAVATDHVIESFRNDLWPGYKTGEGIDQELLDQFPLLEEALAAAGIAVWPMVEHEADDGLASGAAMAAADERVVEVRICTPDKDLAQCVDSGRGGRIVQVDRRRGVRWDADGIREKFGVEPESIPDYLALVGDSADGFPGLRGWGAKSAAAVLAHYVHLEEIPDEPWKWKVKVRSRDRLAGAAGGGGGGAGPAGGDAEGGAGGRGVVPRTCHSGAGRTGQLFGRRAAVVGTRPGTGGHRGEAEGAGTRSAG